MRQFGVASLVWSTHRCQVAAGPPHMADWLQGQPATGGLELKMVARGVKMGSAWLLSSLLGLSTHSLTCPPGSPSGCPQRVVPMVSWLCGDVLQ